MAEGSFPLPLHFNAGSSMVRGAAEALERNPTGPEKETNCEHSSCVQKGERMDVVEELKKWQLAVME